ncbi:hypothetical protein ACFQ5X_50485, partial [Streptomyces kaempferi]
MKAGLTAAGKKAKARAGTARTMDEVVTRTGRELLLKLGRHAGRGRSLDLYRAMSFEEAQNVLGYWNSPARALAEQYVQTGRGTAKEFKQQYQGMTLGAHLAGLEQASVYHSMDSAGYQVLLKFTLKPGAHTVMFDPQFMALGPGYHAELLRRAGGDYQAASQHEGTLPGYIGMKAERHGAFSLTLAQGAHTKGTRSVGPSQLLFQLMVETVTLVSNTSDYLLPGQPTPAIVHTGPPRTTPRIAPRAPQAQLTEHLPEDTGKSRAALSAAFLDAPGNERSLATEHPYGTDTRRSPAETESHGVADELPTIDGRTVVGVPGRDRFVVRAERGKAPELISLRGDAEGNRFEVADVQAGGSVFTVRELDSGGSVVHGWTYRRMGPRLGVSQEVVALSSGFFSGSVVTVSNSTVHDVSVDGALWPAKLAGNGDIVVASPQGNHIYDRISGSLVKAELPTSPGVVAPVTLPPAEAETWTRATHLARAHLGKAATDNGLKLYMQSVIGGSFTSKKGYGGYLNAGVLSADPGLIGRVEKFNQITKDLLHEGANEPMTVWRGVA